MADPTFTNVSLLLRGDGTNGSTSFPDASVSPKTVTSVGGAAVSTSVVKFGTGSASFGGSENLSVSNSSSFDFGTGDLTIECWVYISGNSAMDFDWNRGATIVSSWASGVAPTNGYIFFIQGNSFTTGVGLAFDTWGSSSPQATLFRATATISKNVWHHVAVSVQSGSRRLFLDGVLLSGSTTNLGGGYTTADTYGRAISVGRSLTSRYPSFLVGNIDELRITKGEALYTADFTPPTAEFPGGGSVFVGSTVVEVTSTGAGTVPTTGAGTTTVSVASAGAGAVTVEGQGAATVDVTSVATGTISNPAADFSGSTVVSVTSQATGTVLVRGEGSATVGVTSTATGVVFGDADFSGSALVEVLSSGTGAVMVSGHASAAVSVASSGVIESPVTGTGGAVVGVTSSGAGVLQIAGAGNTLVEVLSTATGAAAITGQGATTINVASASPLRSGIRNFDADVSVRTMLREISVRTEPLSVVAMTAQRQVNATTRQQEVSVLA